MYNVDEQGTSNGHGLMANQFNSEENSAQLRTESVCINKAKMSAGYDY